MKIETLNERLIRYPGAKIEQIGQREYIISTNDKSFQSKNIYNMWIWLKENWSENEKVEQITEIIEEDLSELELELRSNIGRRIRLERPLIGEHTSVITGTIHEVLNGNVHIYSMNGGFRAVEVIDIISHKYIK